MSLPSSGPGTAGPARPGRRDADELLARLVLAPGRQERLVHTEVLPARPGRHAEWPDWVPQEVAAGCARNGIERPYEHQRAAADAAYRGEHVVLATGPASGKSLAYQLPALTAVRDARGPQQQRGAGVLYLAPTKALAHDQLAAVQRLGVDVRAAPLDGDSSPEARQWAREHGEYLLTNPDMLHRSVLPGHHRWADFLGSLRYVVVDECHHYRGVFGAHVAQVLRRLRRVAGWYDAAPVFLLASATVAEPAATGTRLTGLDVTAVTEDASPRGRLAVGLWEPPFSAATGEQGAPVRRSASAETADLLADLAVDDVRTLAFVRSRRAAEQVATQAAEHLTEVDPSLPDRVAAYRGGYLPEERRELEQQLRSGELLGLAATSALELGIDVAGLDAVLLAGFPGTRAAFWQQLGRAGRGAQDALGVLVARDDPLDTYLVTHPGTLLGRPVEATVCDPDNPHVLGPHLAAAAYEGPLTEQDLALFGPAAPGTLHQLVEQGLLRRRPRGWFWTGRHRPADETDIRSAGGAAYQLVEEGTGRVVGTVDASSAHAVAHPGAVYTHRGETWVVQSLDTEERVAVMRQQEVGISTTARDVTEVGIVTEERHRTWPRGRLALGTVAVRQQVVSFLRRRQPGGDVLGEEPLDLPERTLHTTGVWWTVPDEALEAAGLAARDLPGAAHAAEHCAIGLLPLFATCDRWDVGGVSTARHGDTGELTVVVYDGHPGGAGFAERGYAVAARWLHATRETIAACGCEQGCPSCIQSPKCGNQNDPLDKDGALALLDLLLEGVAPE